jgi:hypothetical protein
MSEPVAPTNVYTDAEIAQMHSEDFAAGKAVVILMLGIFGTGVFIYSIVAFWVINYSHA